MNPIIYLVNVSIEKIVEHDWIDYMKEHIPDVLNTGCFESFEIRKRLNHEFNSAKSGKEDNSKYSHYLIEYKCASMKDLKRYFDLYADDLQKDHNVRFKGRYQATREITKDVFKDWFEYERHENFYQ